MIEIYPKFIIKKSSDLMIKGGDFYAIWLEERNEWSTDEHDVLQLIDKELDDYSKATKHKFDMKTRVLHMWDAETGMIDNWHRYCQRQMRDSFHILDEKLIFSNHETTKKDYASKKLDYPLEKGEFPAYEKLISTLYAPEERHKIEWAIGSIVCGDSVKIQKFIVLYGETGTGKSTILNVIQQLFHGYYSTFDAKALGSSSNSFALEAFRDNPLVAIQHDGDLSKIEDNTRLNSLTAHESMMVNEKFKPQYTNQFKSFLFMGTNKPVKITDGKSGLIRRLIDVSPSGNKLSQKDYKRTTKQISFELGAIAYHCKDVYLNDISFYDDYMPLAMLGASNDFYNFMLESYYIFKRDDGVTLKAAWEMYKTYCDDASVSYPLSQRVLKEEMKNYFKDHKERAVLEDGTRVRSYFSGFRTAKFDFQPEHKEEKEEKSWLQFDRQKSVFDDICKGCDSQYASENETPIAKWDNVTTSLSSLDTSKLHYVRVPENHIVIDFDIRDDSGNKSFDKNFEEASKWPPTYAELSKSGAGIHLHYIYSEDVSKLSRVYDDEIEVKVFTGKSSLRRMLTKCNELPISVISSGLPLKGDTKVLNSDVVQSEKSLRTLVRRNLNKEIHASTKPSIDFIYKILEDAYISGIHYDLTDMMSPILAFAASSTNQADYCIKLVNKMHFKSNETSEPKDDHSAPIAFYDVEVFPNLFILNWKYQGPSKPVVRMINPGPKEIESILGMRLVGFNCRRYDNHILYARLMGYTNEQLFNLSQRIINNSPNAFFGEAYGLSYTDIYDFSTKKQSLKKWQIELGLSHQELGLPWDEPVDPSMWDKVAEYCDNDVISTEQVFDHLHEDFLARQILADLSGMTVNDTTNTLTGRLIFGNDKNPKKQFNYRNLGQESDGDSKTVVEDGYLFNNFGDEYTVFDKEGRPIFPGYTYSFGTSTYRGEVVGEGGYVYSEPGMYSNVALLDITSQHPTSIIKENLFGDKYTRVFKELVGARVNIKHGEYEQAKKLLDGKLEKWLQDESLFEKLSKALKIPINSVYGLTCASFDNLFRDPRNVDNIVAKRGALFMINLKHIVQSKGYKVVHIKTDSIKIADADSEIIKFVQDYGLQYGYDFEHEATFDRICLVNDAVYICRYAEGRKKGQWEATGAQFAVPYVFKKLFSKEKIEFEDFCETKAVTTALYLDMNEKLPDVTKPEKELASLVAKAKKNKETLDLSGQSGDEKIDSLISEIATGHNYRFIGKVGLFTPIKKGQGGGILLRQGKDDKNKYSAVSGSTGYRWFESEMVRLLDKEGQVDRSYYDKLVDRAVEDISKFGDFEWFVSNDIAKA